MTGLKTGCVCLKMAGASNEGLQILWKIRTGGKIDLILENKLVLFDRTIAIVKRLSQR